jgi:hypothetical protein
MKQGELNVLLIAKYPVKVHFNAKVMMYEFVLVTKQTIYVYLSWPRILMIQDAESFGFVENVTDTMKFMKFFSFFFYHSCAIFKRVDVTRDVGDT